MYKFIIFAVLVCLSYFELLNAQNPVTEFGIRIKDPVDAEAISDTNGTIAFMFDGHRQYQATIINSDNIVERNVSINKVPSHKKNRLIDLLLNEDSFVAIFYNKKLRTLSSIKLDRATGDYKYHLIKTLNKDELFLNGFAMNNQFYMITVPKKQNEFFLHKCADGITVQSKKYNPKLDNFYALLSQNNSLLNYTPDSEIGIEVVDNALDNNVKKGQSKKKLYCNGKLIYMTFDDKDGTHLFTLDEDEQKLEYKRLNFSLENGDKDPDKAGNSFIIDTSLCRLTMSHEQMNLSIINIPNMALVNNYNFYPDEDIYIQNTSITQDEEKESLFGDGGGKEITKTKKYFNKVLNSNIAIAANKLDSGRVELELGSYQEYVYRNNMMMPMGMGGMGMGMGVGFGMGMGMGMGSFGYPMYGPGMMYPGYYPYGPIQTNVVRKIVSFRSMMNAQNFAHLAGAMPKSIRERVSEYMQNKFRNDIPELFSICYRGQESVLLGYYIEHKNQFVVVEFEL